MAKDKPVFLDYTSSRSNLQHPMRTEIYAKCLFILHYYVLSRVGHAHAWNLIGFIVRGCCYFNSCVVLFDSKIVPPTKKKILDYLYLTDGCLKEVWGDLILYTALKMLNFRSVTVIQTYFLQKVVKIKLSRRFYTSNFIILDNITA